MRTFQTVVFLILLHHIGDGFLHIEAALVGCGLSKVGLDHIQLALMSAAVTFLAETLFVVFEVGSLKLGGRLGEVGVLMVRMFRGGRMEGVTEAVTASCSDQLGEITGVSEGAESVGW